MRYSHGSPLQSLILQRLLELGTPPQPMSLRDALERTGAPIPWEHLRALVRGERDEILTRTEIEAIATAIDVPVGDVENVVTELPDL